MKNNWIKIIIVGLIAIISILFIIQNKKSNLELFKNTSLADNNKINKILRLLDYGKDKFIFNISDDRLNINYSVELFNYKTLEKNASILFYLIDDLNSINYQINDDSYSFSYDKISLIYDDYKDVDINGINERYKGKNFSSLYLGNINGNVNLFDTSDLCIDNYIELKTTEDVGYYITCSSIDSIVVSTETQEYTLLEALENGIIDIDDLFETNLKINRRSINNENFD